MVQAFTGNKIPDRNCNEIFDFFTKKPESKFSQKQKENLLNKDINKQDASNKKRSPSGGKLHPALNVNKLK